ncbi:hypothetical protein [Streptomyces albireticuli]|uniref:hypothetical protein n=1 Tax=Streptomyces albireticuli TaxID=1940 RepID=UPI0013316F2E|nr:hypothetical protein [Streptomyces albireticuli]
MTDVVIDFKWDEFAWNYADHAYHSYGGGWYGTHGRYDMKAEAESAATARGFGLIDGGNGNPLEWWSLNGYYSCDCGLIRTRVNYENAVKTFELAGVECWEWRGYVAYDASSRRGREIAAEIGASLTGYPVLDDERLSELEWDAAVEYINDQCGLPEGVDAADVLREMPEVPPCMHCFSCDAEDVLTSFGYSSCMDCSAWIKADGYPVERVCYDCADREQEGDCSCIPNYVDTLRHMSLYPTASDLREIQRGCETCYPIRWPHGDAKVGM